jgi:hypothetical protein
MALCGLTWDFSGHKTDVMFGTGASGNFCLNLQDLGI